MNNMSMIKLEKKTKTYQKYICKYFKIYIRGGNVI